MQAVKCAEAAVMRHLVGKLLGEGDILTLTPVDSEAVEALVQLPHLFPEGHAGEQIFRT